MYQIIYEGKLSEARVVSIEPFVTTNEALARFDMQKITLANGTISVMPKAELDRCLTTKEEAEVVVAEEPVIVEPVVEVEPEPVAKKGKASKKVVADQDASASL